MIFFIFNHINNIYLILTKYLSKMNTTQIYHLYDKNFYLLQDDECYFFSYSYLHIELISERIGRNVPFYNGMMRNYARIYCDNGTENSVASIGYLINSTLYGIIVKMKYSELEILDKYENGYNRVTLPVYCLDNHTKINCYIYVKNSSLNIYNKLPSIEYLNLIRKMLDNRRLYNKYLLYIPLNIYVYDKSYINDDNDDPYKLIQIWSRNKFIL